jgi:hypothetical protein
MKIMALAALILPLSMCQFEQPGAGLPCSEWAQPALANGWTEADLPRLLPIIHRESRCQPDAVRYGTSRHRPADVGLLQINQIHRPTLARIGLEHLDMTDPALNLQFGRWLFDWHNDRGLDPWSPWKRR